MSYTKLTQAQLNAVPVPADDYDLAMLLPEKRYPGTMNIEPGFETVEWCVIEDRRRAASLRTLPAELQRMRFFKPAELADSLDRAAASGKSALTTLASALQVREARLRFLGATLEFVSNNSGQALADPALITVTHPSWRLCAREGWEWERFRVRSSGTLRSALREAGVLAAPGYLIAYFQGQFDPTAENFQLRYRGICAGEKLNILRRRTAEANGVISRLQVCIHREKVDAWQISCMMPNFVPTLPQIMIDTAELPPLGYHVAHLPEPFHGVYVSWLHLQRLVDLIVLNGVAIKKGRLTLSHF